MKERLGVEALTDAQVVAAVQKRIRRWKLFWHYRQVFEEIGVKHLVFPDQDEIIRTKLAYNFLQGTRLRCKIPKVYGSFFMRTPEGKDRLMMVVEHAPGKTVAMQGWPYWKRFNFLDRLGSRLIRSGLVHGDLHSENVILTPVGQTYVIDWEFFRSINPLDDDQVRRELEHFNDELHSQE